MKRCLCILAFAGLLVGCADRPEPPQLAVVSQFFSDNGGLFYYRVLDVGPEAVRYVRVAPASLQCQRTIVQATQSQVATQVVADVVRRANPCAIQPRELEAAITKYARREGVFEAISFGIQARCGSSSVVLGLPMPESVNMDTLREARPDIAGLWDLAGEIERAAFGEQDLFHNRSEADELALQRAGEASLPELISGKYDAGLAAAVKGNVGSWKLPSFRELLSDYRGPLTRGQVEAALAPRLANPELYSFATYAAPKYSVIAKNARVQGSVEVEMRVRRETGEVTDVTVLSGHPMLKPSAIEAAKQWRFVPGSVEGDTVKATVEYSLSCP